MIFENLRFRPSTRRKGKASVLKNLHSRDRFEYLLFCCSKTPFTCGQKATTARKSPFSKISGYLWMGPLFSFSVHWLSMHKTESWSFIYSRVYRRLSQSKLRYSALHVGDLNLQASAYVFYGSHDWTVYWPLSNRPQFPIEDDKLTNLIL